jgi:glycosyltransferase involved in cell wall biosynthesis
LLVPAPVHRLLLLIPAYNEERRIEPVLRRYATYFRQEYPGEFELIVLLNGCRDNTAGVVQRVAREFPSVRGIEYRDPIGKGGALIEGLRLAPRADWIGYVDADGATPPHAFHDLVRHLEADGADAVIGSRWLKESVLHQAQPGQRRFASRVFHLIVQCLFWMNIRDTQCGAKVFRRQAIEAIHHQLHIADMAFDINLLYALKRAGFQVREVPTEWTDQAGSKVTIGFTSLTMLFSVIRLRVVYSPLAPLLRWLRPLEAWVYRRLRAPAPLPRNAPAREVDSSVTAETTAPSR